MFTFSSLFKILGSFLFIFMIVFSLSRYYNAQSSKPKPNVTVVKNGSIKTSSLTKSEKENYYQKIYDKTWVYIKNSDMKKIYPESFSKNKVALMQAVKDKIFSKAPYKNKEKFVGVDPEHNFTDQFKTVSDKPEKIIQAKNIGAK